jgi:hypothetical protein
MGTEILDEGYYNDPRKNIHPIYVKEMIINPFEYVQPINYTMEAFVAPANFDPDAQEMNIVKAFATYPNVNKKYIFSVGNSTTTVLSAEPGRSYAYSENGGAYTAIASGTITWTVGSIKRNIIGIDVSESINVKLPHTAIWAYCSESIYSVSSIENISLKYIHFQRLNSLTDLSAYASFEGCDLTGVLTIPNTINFIGPEVFYNQKKLIGNLTIPNSVTSIGSAAFFGCSGFTGNLNLSNSLISVASSAFYGCSGFIGNLELPVNINTIGNNSFSQLVGMTGIITMYNNVVTIGTHAFEGSNFTGVLNLSSGVTRLLDLALEGLGKIDTINMFDNLTRIDYEVFGYCSLLRTVTFPSTLQTIGGDAFYRSWDLTTINAKMINPIVISNSVFAGINKTTCILHVPVGSLAAYQSAQYWNEFTNIIADL